jgi:RHS repeat-associated protein
LPSGDERSRCVLICGTRKAKRHPDHKEALQDTPALHHHAQRVPPPTARSARRIGATLETHAPRVAVWQPLPRRARGQNEGAALTRRRPCHYTGLAPPAQLAAEDERVGAKPLYGPGGGRAYSNWPHAQLQTWHVGDLYEKQRTFSGSSAAEEHRYSVFAGGKRVAEVKRSRPNDTTAFTRETTYLHHDRLGSLVATTDESGEVTGEYTYGVFGQPNQELPVPYGYTGHRYEAELGLTDAGGRFYDAKFGIFLSPDPIGPLNGGSTFGNRYSYAGYDPINFVDPTGFQEEMASCFQGPPDPDGTPNMICVPVPVDPDPNPPVPGVPDPGPIDCELVDCVSDDGVIVLPPAPSGGVPAGSSGSTSGGTPRIDRTADGQMFGVAGTTYLPTASELLEDYYTPEGAMVTCSVAGPWCSDGSGYVFGWSGNPYTQRGRELDSAAGAFAGELSLVPSARTAFDSDASAGDRLWAGGEIGVSVFGGNIVRGGVRFVGAVGSFARGAGATVSLFRAVGDAELKLVQASGGRIPASLSGLEVKYFSATAEGASSYARQAVRGFGDAPYTLIEAQIPRSALPANVLHQVDQNVPAVILPNSYLPSLGPAQVWTYMPVP